MAIEYLSSGADFAHLDGALAYPLFVDDYHALIMEDGVILLLPAGMQVHFPGRFSIDSGGPHVDTKVSGEEAHTLALWGQGLQSADLLDHIRANIALVLAESANPERYVNRPECLREEV